MRLLILLCLLFAPAVFADERDTLQAREQELEALTQRIAAIERELQRDRDKQQSLADEVERIERRVAALQGALQQVQQDLAQRQAEAGRLRERFEALQSAMGERRRALAQQLRAAYIVGRRARTRLWLSQDDPARLARLNQYFAYFQRQRIDGITALREDMTELGARREALDAALADLDSLARTREQTLAGIRSQREARQQALERVSARLQQSQRERGALQSRQHELEALIRSLESAVQQLDQAAVGGDFPQQQGRLLRPLEGRVLARFRERKADGESRWNGLWLGAPADTPVKAIAAGRVVYVGWMHRYGLLLVIDHGQGYFSLYGHNGRVEKSLGDSVAAGDTVAMAGDTGGHRQSGVYLEIRKGRKAQDPEKWLRAAAH